MKVYSSSDLRANAKRYDCECWFFGGVPTWKPLSSGQQLSISLGCGFEENKDHDDDDDENVEVDHENAPSIVNPLGDFLVRNSTMAIVEEKAKIKKNLWRYSSFEIPKEVEGKFVVELLKEDVEEGASHWRYVPAGHLMGAKPSFHVVHAKSDAFWELKRSF
ncbi:hypothetical protein Cni_G06248 [Canna indica]|uniref:Uncharacterized protein n=1 Tax=Canna indica TaxID=4628 RepID=A0AAQ3Q5S4_9LILI|nr:hypothetical protein Cni_G06248 [Canna indica]